MNGWIRLHRIIREHWTYQEKRQFSKFEAWVDLLLEANHKDCKFVLGNELVECKRGQAVISQRKLEERWGWSNTKVKNFLELLQKDEMITYYSDSKKTVITIVNYDFYQGGNDIEPSEKHHTSETETSGKHMESEQTKIINNDKNVNNISSPKKEKELKFPADSIEYRLADYLRKHILRNHPKAKVPTDKGMDEWSKHIDYMIRLDKRDPEDIKAVIDFSQNDGFWMTTILSTSKLRKQFDQLYLKSKNQHKNKPIQVNGQSQKYKTKFHLAESRGDKYTADELEALILNNQRAKREGNK